MINKSYLIITAVLIFNAIPLFSDTQPETVYTEDKYYITSGTLTLNCPIETASEILLDLEHYRNWVFLGLGKDEPKEEWRIAYLQDAIYNREEAVMYVIFGIHLFQASTRNSSGNSLGFKTEIIKNPDGTLSKVVFSLNEKNPYLREADYGFELTAAEDKTLIYYFGIVKLAPFINFFFNLKIYKSNIEWYAVRLVKNLEIEADRVQGNLTTSPN